MKRQSKETKYEINLVNLIEQFGSEDKCRTFLEEVRWSQGVECPRCKSKSISNVEDRNQYDCNSCRYQFSVTCGTVLHDTHLPLWKWFLTAYMMIEAKKGVSANQIKRTIDVSYKTAWYLCHRIRSAMAEACNGPLTGTLEADENLDRREGQRQGTALHRKQGYRRRSRCKRRASPIESHPGCNAGNPASVPFGEYGHCQA
jgi:transposase-like protein